MIVSASTGCRLSPACVSGVLMVRTAQPPITACGSCRRHRAKSSTFERIFDD
jgi:hypothetical protein